MSPFGIVSTELLKLRRSKITWVSLAAYCAIGLVVGFMMWIIGHPGMAESLGLVGQKVSFAAAGVSANWAGFLLLVVEMSGIGGMILYSVIVAYVFGREYAEATAKNLLALPVARWRFVLAKLLVSMLWFAILSLALILESLAIGATLGLEAWSTSLFLHQSGQVLLGMLLVFAIGPAVALIAVASGGYLAPLGFAIFSLVIGTAIGATNWARYFPYAIIGLFSGAAGPRVEELGIASYIILAAYFLVTALATGLWLSKADNCQ